MCVGGGGEGGGERGGTREEGERCKGEGEAGVEVEPKLSPQRGSWPLSATTLAGCVNERVECPRFSSVNKALPGLHFLLQRRRRLKTSVLFVLRLKS